MPILEPNFYALWAAKQTAKGTPATVATRRLIQVAGNFGMTRDDGEEPYSDLSKYGNRTDWVNSLLGTGEPGIEATPTELAWLLWAFHGAESVLAVASVAGPPAVPASSRHRFEPSLGIGHPLTFWQRVGQSVMQRRKFNDCFITRLVIEGSTANKAVRVTPRILSLDPGETFASDLLGAGATNLPLPTDRPFLYTDVKSPAASAFTIDGVAFAGQTEFTLTIDDAWDVVYGDDAVPYDFVQGTPTVTLAVTVHMDALALARWNVIVYGTATPPTGTKPLRNLPALGSYLFDMKQRDNTGAANGRGFRSSIPGIKWTLPDAPAPNPAGGGTTLTLAGAMRPTTVYVPGTGWTTAPYTIDVNTADTVLAFTN